jgi:hypothetical protein
MANVIRIKRGLESGRSGETPAQGELIYTTDNKKVYIGDGSTAGGIPVTGDGNVQVVKGSVDFTSATGQSIGTLPANADVIRTRLEVTAESDVATTATVGDSVNGAASYMAASDNDPEVEGSYISENYVPNGGGDRTIVVNVTTAGSTGGATCIVEFRVP